MSEERPVKCALCKNLPKQMKDGSCYADTSKCEELNHSICTNYALPIPAKDWNKKNQALSTLIESKEREAFIAGAYFCNSHGLSEAISKFDEWDISRGNLK